MQKHASVIESSLIRCPGMSYESVSLPQQRYMHSSMINFILWVKYDCQKYFPNIDNEGWYRKTRDAGDTAHKD